MQHQAAQAARLVLLAEAAITSSAPHGRAVARNAILCATSGSNPFQPRQLSQSPGNTWRSNQSASASASTTHLGTAGYEISAKSDAIAGAPSPAFTTGLRPEVCSSLLHSGRGDPARHAIPRSASPLPPAPYFPPPAPSPILITAQLCAPHTAPLHSLYGPGGPPNHPAALESKLGCRPTQQPTASAVAAAAAIKRTFGCFPPSTGTCLSRPPALLALERLWLPQPGAEALRWLSSSGGGATDGRSDGRQSAPPPLPPPASDAVYNLPNAVSAARLLSGPVIGFWLVQGHYEAATVALAISGASDWLDGFLARRMGASSVFGSYLDPLADKVLIGCVAAALLANGAMPPWLAALVVGRDLALVAGAFTFRLRGFGWRWPGREAFFRTADTTVAAPPQSASAAEAAGALPGGPSAGVSAGGGEPAGGGGGEGGGVAFMRPLLLSKANTVLQLVLLGGYLTRGMYGWPEGDLLAALELATAGTTVLSLAAYGRMAVQGKLFK